MTRDFKGRAELMLASQKWRLKLEGFARPMNLPVPELSDFTY